MTRRDGPLTGYRVLDLTRALAGPYGTGLLGDLGAEIVKIEQPGIGDESRHWGPPFFGGESAYFLSMNRHKRSVALDLKTPEAVDLCRRLARLSDVVVENFRPGVADRLGLGYRALRELHPALVYCSISAYGQDGPLAQEPGYDLIMQGVGGLMSVTGEPGGRPLKAGVAETDILAGTNAALAIVAALLARERRRAAGEPAQAEYLDVGLFDGQVALMGYHLVGHLLSGTVPGPAGNALPYIVPYQAFRTADIEITIACNNDRLWRAFCAAIERPDLLADHRFATNGDRVRNRDALVPLLEDILRARPGDEWLARLSRAGVPAGPINTMDRVAAHPQLQARHLLVDVDHPVGTVTIPTTPWKAGLPGERAVDDTPAPPPLLGEHTEQVLRTLLDLTEDQVRDLEARGVVQCGSPHPSHPTGGSPASPTRGSRSEGDLFRANPTASPPGTGRLPAPIPIRGGESRLPSPIPGRGAGGGGTMSQLDGRAALVTGGGRGIGEAVCRTLAARGAAVAVVDLDRAPADEVAAAISAAGGRALALGCDVTDRDQVEAAVQRTADAFGRLDILVACAGILRDNLIYKLSDEDWDAVIGTHLRGSFLAARAAQRFMVAQRYGKMVFTSSTSALGNRGQANYAAAKAGLQGFTRTLAIELGPFNVNVNAVAPGFIESRMTRATAERIGMSFEEFKAQRAAETPLRRVGQPQDVANVVAFLVSDESSFVSGQTIYVAGGPRG